MTKHRFHARMLISATVLGAAAISLSSFASTPSQSTGAPTDQTVVDVQYRAGPDTKMSFTADSPRTLTVRVIYAPGHTGGTICTASVDVLKDNGGSHTRAEVAEELYQQLLECIDSADIKLAKEKIIIKNTPPADNPGTFDDPLVDPDNNSNAPRLRWFTKSHV